MHTFSGHFDEVTALLPWDHDTLLSVSIDGTIRRWDLDSLRQDRIEKAVQQPSTKVQTKKSKPSSRLTEDEERELDELMDEDEDDEA